VTQLIYKRDSITWSCNTGKHTSLQVVMPLPWQPMLLEGEDSLIPHEHTIVSFGRTI